MLGNIRGRRNSKDLFLRFERLMSERVPAARKAHKIPWLGQMLTLYSLLSDKYPSSSVIMSAKSRSMVSSSRFLVKETLGAASALDLCFLNLAVRPSATCNVEG